MNRRSFIRHLTAAGASLQASRLSPASLSFPRSLLPPNELNVDLVIIGAGLGGCAAALAAVRNGLQVVLTEETDWIGGQVSQQAVPPTNMRGSKDSARPNPIASFAPGSEITAGTTRLL